MNQSNSRDLAIVVEKEILDNVTKAMRSSAGPKRWFWELLQNAIDTIAEKGNRKVKVKVNIEPTSYGAEMTFIHDGECFQDTSNENKFDDFKNLILPRSGKKTSNKKTVGKFGTGFLSTHNLSLKIDVKGVFQPNEGSPFKVKTALDRTYFMDEDDQFDGKRIDSITAGMDEYYSEMEKKEPVTDSDYTTKFKYYLNGPSAIEKLRTGLKDIEFSLPIVMTLNSKIEKIQIENNLDNLHYSFYPGNWFNYNDITITNTIKENNKGKQTSSVMSIKADNITVCWPIEAYNEGSPIKFLNVKKDYHKTVKDTFPIVYCTFPLIGSGTLKFPVIIHSDSFKPNETRDGISLTNSTYEKDGENDGEKEIIELDKENKTLLVKAVSLYKSFIEKVSEDAESLYFISEVNGFIESDWIDKDWHKTEISSSLKEIIKTTPIIDVSENKTERKSILNNEGEIKIFFPTLSNGDDNKKRPRLNQKLFILSKHLFGNKIPLWKDLKYWHEILWQEKDVIKILNIEDIVEEVASYGSLKKLASKLNRSISDTLKWLNYLYLLIDDLSEGRLYKDYPILPNQKGNFKLGERLYSENPDSKIEPEMICVLRSLNSLRDWFDYLVHREVKCAYHFEQKSLKEDVGPEINQILVEKTPSGYYKILLDKPRAVRVLQRLLSFKIGVSRKTSDKQKAFHYSQEIFGSKKERIVEFYNDFNTDNAVKHIFRLINTEIEDTVNLDGLSKLLKKDKKSTISWLNDYLNSQVKSADYENLVHWANIIPNQYEDFCAHGKQEDKVRIYKPYSIVNQQISDELDKTIIKVLKDLSSEFSHDWKKILVMDGINLTSLPTKTWQDLGHGIDDEVRQILSTIVEDSQDQKEKYLQPMLTLLDWCEQKSNKKIAEEYFKTTYTNKDKLWLQLTFSTDTVEILKDKHSLNIAKRFKASGIPVDQVNQTIDVLESIQKKIGENAVSDFISKAEKYMSTKEKFKNRFETGQNIEELLKDTLKEEHIDVDVNKSDVGSYDIKLTKQGDVEKELLLEVKSYGYGSTFDFRFANSQIIEANKDSSKYIVCTLERRPNDEVCDIEYLKRNLKVQPQLGQLTSGIIQTVKEFDDIYLASKQNIIPLEIPCIEEPRVKMKKEILLNNTGDYYDLLNLIKQKISGQ